MNTNLHLREILPELRARYQQYIDVSRLPYFSGCSRKVLIVADNFLYFDNGDFGLSELVSTLRAESTGTYPVEVKLAHRGNPSASQLNGGTPNFVFEYDELKKYHQVWIMAAETRFSDPISIAERQAIRRFMDEGGGIFATGDHEDLGVSVGGYIPRVRSMRKWFWPDDGPNGEPAAPDGSTASRHDTNREGSDPGFSFDDQSDDIPQRIRPRYFGGVIQTVHPVLCGPAGPSKVLPDHPHEGECIAPASLGGDFDIGGDSIREYPDGPDGNPLAPQVIATSTMIPGAEAPRFGKPPIPGGTFGAIGAWDGHRAGPYGRVVVDATWHHFINVNLTGDRSAGPPDPAVPKSLGFLYSASGIEHLKDIKTYFTNILDWLTPRPTRRCLLLRGIWWAVNQGAVLENLRATDPISTGHHILDQLRLRTPCSRIGLIDDLLFESEHRLPWRGLIDPFEPRSKEIDALADGMSASDIRTLSTDVPAALVGAAGLGILACDLSVQDVEKSMNPETGDIPEFSVAAKKSVSIGMKAISYQLEQQIAARKNLLAIVR